MKWLKEIINLFVYILGVLIIVKLFSFESAMCTAAAFIMYDLNEIKKYISKDIK
jgi:hypothetical protein